MPKKGIFSSSGNEIKSLHLGYVGRLETQIICFGLTAKICRMTFDEILALQDRYKIIFKKVVNIISGL